MRYPPIKAFVLFNGASQYWQGKLIVHLKPDGLTCYIDD